MNKEEPTIKIQAKGDWVPKTNQRRIIPLNTHTVEIIRKQSRSDKHDFVFKGKSGGKINQNRMYNGLKGALKRLGLEGDIHKFRHTFASHLVMNGIGLETVSKLLGHSSIEMTIKYAHLAPDHLQRAVQMLEPDED